MVGIRAFDARRREALRARGRLVTARKVGNGSDAWEAALTRRMVLGVPCAFDPHTGDVWEWQEERETDWAAVSAAFVAAYNAHATPGRPSLAHRATDPGAP